MQSRLCVSAIGFIVNMFHIGSVSFLKSNIKHLNEKRNGQPLPNDFMIRVLFLIIDLEVIADMSFTVSEHLNCKSLSKALHLNI